MKKLLSVFIGLMIMLSAVVPVSAAGLNVTVVSSANVTAGGNITFTVSLSGSLNATSGSISVSFDDNFELISGEFLKSGALLSNFDTKTNKGAIAFNNATNMNGEYFKLVLKAKKAGAADQKVIISVELKNGASSIGSNSVTKAVKIVCSSHTYGSYTKVNDNQHKHTCSVCGHVEAVNHTWNSGTVTKQATCKDTGIKTFTCTACNATKTETIAKTNNHTYGSWTTTKEATCTATGTQERSCSVCGKKETKSIAATGHSYGAWKVTKEATCTAGGTETRTCSKCSATETRNTKVLGHSFSSPTVTKQPTCTEPGIESGKCTRCGQTITQKIKATGHKFGAWGVVKEATCTDKGTEERACSVCQQKETREIKALGHDFENPTIVKEATLSSTGLKEGKCKRCGETTQEVIPCRAKDESTGISIEADQGVFADGTTTNFTDKSTDESLKNALSDYGTKYTAYAVDFTRDGAAVKPNGEYKLLLPNSARLTAENIFVCFVAEDGTVTEKAFTLNGDGTISVKTAEAGTYAVVDKLAGNSSEIDTNSGSDNSSVVPGSNEPGQKNNTLWIILAIIAAVAVVGGTVTIILFVKKRNND